MAQRLVLDKGIDDHSRPNLPLWRRYRFQPTQIALLLFTDGRVIETDTLYVEAYLAADDVAAGGHESVYADDAWQVGVLLAAGYTLVPAEDREML
jgi:hypothetical protein